MRVTTLLVATTFAISLVVPADGEPTIPAKGKAGAPTIETPYWRTKGCVRGYTSRTAYARIHRLLRVPRPLKRGTGRKLRRYSTCQITFTKSRAVKAYVRRSWRWRKEHRWEIAFYSMSPSDQVWAKSTGSCESGNDPTAHSQNGDHGAMQFKLPTARSAGFAGDPHTTSIYEQWVRGVRWRNVAGRGQWPRCG